MELKEHNILFFTRTMKLGGTENVILQLCEVFMPLVNKIVVCSCGGVNIERLKEMKICHYEIPDIENKSWLVILKVLRILSSIVKKENITIIHTHHRMAAFYVSLLRLHKKCYFFNTSHNTFNNKICLTRFAYKHANLIACGECVKKNLVEQFRISDSRIMVIHNAVKVFKDKIAIDFLIKELHDKGYFVIGNIGRLAEQKGMGYYIGSIPAITEKHPNSRFLIIGAGEDEHKLKKLVKDNGIEKYVFFMGYRNDIQNIMCQLDLLVLSSLWEGLPLAPIEAFSVGKTVIATAVDGTVEIIENGKNGFLVEPKHSEQIAEKVSWIIEHPEERKKMEESARMRYENKFSFEKMAAGYVNFYTQKLRGN